MDKKHKPLTPKQQRVLQFLQSFQAKHGYAPSIREVASEFDLAINGIRQSLATLQAKGFLTVAPGVARGIALKDDAIAVEREACARIAEAMHPDHDVHGLAANRIAAAIRARGNVSEIPCPVSDQEGDKSTEQHSPAAENPQ